jgi:hypothetical protein
MNGNALLSYGCEEETLNPHEDINKNESIEGGWGAGCSPPGLYPSWASSLSPFD